MKYAQDDPDQDFLEIPYTDLVTEILPLSPEERRDIEVGHKSYWPMSYNHLVHVALNRVRAGSSDQFLIKVAMLYLAQEEKSQ